MSHIRASSGTVAFGALALALLAAGCGGNGSSFASASGGSGLVPGAQSGAPAGIAKLNLTDASGLTSPDKHRHRRGCAPQSLTQNFNGQAIAAGSYILFTSVMQFGGDQNGAIVQMEDSTVGFSSGSYTYTIKGPAMRLVYGAANVKLSYAKHWRMKAPAKTAGKDFLDDVVFLVPRDLPGNIKNVTWAARFYSRSAIKQMQWQWGAAVYTSLPSTYGDLGVKPLDDQNYPPYNNDHAGTPENDKGFLTAGGTGNGGNDYTGVGGPNGNITPCK